VSVESLPRIPADFDSAAARIIEAGRFLDARGWAPATSGNYSMRLSDGSLAMSVSGVHKGRLSPEHILRLSSKGVPLEPKTPSAEAGLHVQIYDTFPQARAVLHVHSVPGVALARILSGDTLVLEGYEMLKIFPGIKTHDTRSEIPIVENSQDMAEITKALAPRLKDSHAYLIQGHGFYVWADTMDKAEYLVEALDHLLQCELEILKVRGVKA
jgi:methylthioribulose-1-phosphate dehydratase